VTDFETSRRNVFTGLAAAGVALPVLAACGDDSASDATGSTDTDTSPSESPTASESASASESATAAAGAIKTSDIPVGGGKIFKGDKIVVTQPASGDFKAFTAVCTHQGCTVSSVEDSTINCVCHGSKFSIEDGSVQNGPATAALSAKTVEVSGDSLTVS
jgi:Rieske Fe-S protein